MHSVGSRSYNRYKSKWEECLQHQVSELNRVWQERGSWQGFPVKVPGGKQTWGGQTRWASAGNSETGGFPPPKTHWFPSVLSFFLVDNSPNWLHALLIVCFFFLPHNEEFQSSGFYFSMKVPFLWATPGVQEWQTQRNESGTRRGTRRAVTLRDLASARCSAAAHRVHKEHLASGDYILWYERVKFLLLLFFLETYRRRASADTPINNGA